MSTPADVLTALSEQLQDNANLSYFNDELIFIGAREGITTFPAICIERVEMDEQEFVYPVATLKMIVELIILIKCEDKNRQLIGTPTATPAIRGTLDVENDVKLAIDSDRTLGGSAIHTEILDSADGVVEFPVRSVNLRLSITFRQTREVRT